MTRLLDLPPEERQALVDQVDKEVAAMQNGRKEPVFDEKGEHIGTTFFGDGSKLPETIFKTVVISPGDLQTKR
jgi:hypothetical protein